MTKLNSKLRFRRTVLALAICSALGTVYAQERFEETTVNAGVGFVGGTSADRALPYQYKGLRNRSGATGLLSFEYILRDDEKLDWIDFKGDDLLGVNRESNLTWRDPGSWKFTADYSELVRYDPNTINSGMVGSGSTSPQVVRVPVGTGSDFDLQTKRSGMSVGLIKWVSPTLQMEVGLKTEKKEGSRLFGIGMSCPSAVAPGCGPSTGINTGSAVLLLPEPINATHNQIEARLSYVVDKLLVNLGYYGSFYANENATLAPSIPGSLNNSVGGLLPLSNGLQGVLSQRIALAPDNQAHQFDVSGLYSFSDSTRATFRLGYARATQRDSFEGLGFVGVPAGVTSLGAEVHTTNARLGLTARPVPKLSLLADWRYDDRDDRTPIAVYNLAGSGPTAMTWTNRNLPNRKIRGKLQANWQFSSDYRGTVGADVETIDRGSFTPSSQVFGVSAFRQNTRESSVSAELRRRMSESFSGSIGVSRSRRDGSNWLMPNAGKGVIEVSNPTDAVNGFLPTSVFMPTLADRQRDKAKLFADWQPSAKLSLQVSAEKGSDSFTTPTVYGLRDTGMDQFSVDLGYALSASWALNGYASKGSQTLNQLRPAGYAMAFSNKSLGAGLGITGKPMSKLEMGANLSFFEDVNVYAQTLDVFAGADAVTLLAASGGLPDITYRQTTLKLFGKYVLDPKSSIGVDLVFQRTNFDDWAWINNGVPYGYSDGTTVIQKPNQNVAYLGVTYSYRWQ